MNRKAHTPTPWHVTPGKGFAAEIYAQYPNQPLATNIFEEADAEFIVRAVNGFEKVQCYLRVVISSPNPDCAQCLGQGDVIQIGIPCRHCWPDEIWQAAALMEER